MAEPRARDAIDLPRGAAFMVAAAFLFAGMGAAVKLLSQSLGNSVVVFFRSGLGLLMLLPLLPRLGRAGLGTQHLREHVIRGVAGLGAMYCFFYAIAHLRLADAVLLNYSLPLFVPFVESAWLGERVPRRFWRAIVIGFLGIVLILKPGLSLFQPAAFVGLGAALLAALAQTGVRRLTRTEPVTRIVLYFGVVTTVVSALPAAAAWATPTAAQWPTLLALGVCATLGQIFMTRAYSHAPAAQVGPFIYSAVVFAGVFDFALFGLLPDAFTLLGALLVCGAGILTLRLAAAARTPPPEPAGA